MIEKICINKPKYGRYFLFSEAPGDDEDKEVETRDVTPEEDDFDTDFNDMNDEDFENITLDDDDDDMDTDFNALGLDDIDDVTLDDEPADDDIDTNFNSLNDNQDTTDTNTRTQQLNPPQQPQNPEPNQNQPNMTQQQPTDDVDTPTDTVGTDDIGDTTGAEDPDEYADMDTNFNDDGTEEPTDDQTGDTTMDDTAGTEDKPKGPGVEYDSTRKYVLFQKYISLYNAISNYIGKLENITKDDIEFNQVLKVSTNKLREIKDLTFEYMTIKFKASTYVQSLLFYQQLIVSVQLVFRTISNMNKEVQKKDNKK